MLDFTVTVRDKEGKILRDASGIKQPQLNLGTRDYGTKATMAIEAECKSIAKFIEAVGDPTHRINVEVYSKNNISNTYMNMFSYYHGENRFVKHK